MSLTLCQALAPSTVAASKREGSMPINAARNMIALHPISFHVSERRTSQGKALVSVRKEIGSPPKSLMTSLSTPFEGDRMARRMAYMMTQERKWGR